MGERMERLFLLTREKPELFQLLSHESTCAGIMRRTEL